MKMFGIVIAIIGALLLIFQVSNIPSGANFLYTLGFLGIPLGLIVVGIISIFFSRKKQNE